MTPCYHTWTRIGEGPGYVVFVCTRCGEERVTMAEQRMVGRHLMWMPIGGVQ